jgi:hypothetical protein
VEAYWTDGVGKRQRAADHAWLAGWQQWAMEPEHQKERLIIPSSDAKSSEKLSCRFGWEVRHTLEDSVISERLYTVRPNPEPEIQDDGLMVELPTSSLVAQHPYYCHWVGHGRAISVVSNTLCQRTKLTENCLFIVVIIVNGHISSWLSCWMRLCAAPKTRCSKSWSQSYIKWKIQEIWLEMLGKLDDKIYKRI